jgi:RNA polymerase sigma-70 factor (ECF subfamily)
VAPEFAGCARAFDEEFDYLYRVLRRQGIGPTDAEDLAQDVFVVMCRRWPDYDPERPLRPWLAGIAFRVAHDFRKRAGREVPIGVVNETDQAPDAEHWLGARRRRFLLRQAVESLPAKHREVVAMDLEGDTIHDICKRLSVSMFTGYARLRKARFELTKAVRRLQTVEAIRGGAGAPALPPRTADDSRRRPSSLRALALVSGARGGAGRAAGVSPGAPLAIPHRSTPSVARTLGRLAVAAAAVTALGVGVSTLTTARQRTAHARGPARTEVSAGGVRPEGWPAASRARALGAAAALAPSQRPPVQIEDGIVGYWRFDDGRGNQAVRELSGGGNDCVLHGLDPAASWVEGSLGGALSLSGQGWLECPATEALERLTGGITVSAWVARVRSGKVLDALVTRQTGTSTKDQFFFGFYKDRLIVASTLWGKGASAPFTSPDGRWTHVAFTHQPDGATTLFIDGVAVGRGQGEPADLSGNTRPLVIGGGMNGPDGSAAAELFSGGIDEVLVYDRALGDAEVRALSRGAQPRLSP